MKVCFRIKPTCYSDLIASCAGDTCKNIVSLLSDKKSRDANSGYHSSHVITC